MQPPGERPVELRIAGWGRRVYWNTFVLWLLAALVGGFYWGFEAIVLTDGPDFSVGVVHHHVGIVTQLWATAVGGVGTLVALGVIAAVIFGTVRTWYFWRQLRYPGAVVDAAGIRFEARRRPIMIPWTQVEALKLERTISETRAKTSIVSRLWLHVLPDAAVLHTDLSPIPANRELRLGNLERDADVPYEEAVDILKLFAGPLLVITEERSWVGELPPKR
jgi:hypothetical protein